jgi:hypothetical protein
MPGKVNPTQAEALTMIAVQVESLKLQAAVNSDEQITSEDLGSVLFQHTKSLTTPRSHRTASN